MSGSLDHSSRLYVLVIGRPPPRFTNARRCTLQGVRVEVRAADRSGLLSDFTRVLREHGLSLLRVELRRHKDDAFGIFYLVTDTGGEVRTEALRAVQARVAEMDISLNVVKEAPGWPPVRKTSVPAPPVAGLSLRRGPDLPWGAFYGHTLGSSRITSTTSGLESCSENNPPVVLLQSA